MSGRKGIIEDEATKASHAEGKISCSKFNNTIPCVTRSMTYVLGSLTRLSNAVRVPLSCRTGMTSWVSSHVGMLDYAVCHVVMLCNYLILGKESTTGFLGNPRGTSAERVQLMSRLIGCLLFIERAAWSILTRTSKGYLQMN